ncbi:MAG: glycosyl hydrolase 53 family protein [Clostridiales bacterium]|nr:glycosyl hydrolase 53 family protein [Clostridiales bacterium]
MKRIIFLIIILLMPVTVHAADFAYGGDITQLNYIEDMGGKYYDSEGKPQDAVICLAECGINTVRIRLSNNPGKGRGDGQYYMPEGYQNEEDCLKLAKRAKAAGLDIVWTFNYSDYWSNGERQLIPSDWVGEIKNELGFDVTDANFLSAMTGEQKKTVQNKLAELVYSYTYRVLKGLKDEGIAPKYVSLGNEIRGGMFFPFANTYSAEYDTKAGVLAFDSREGTVKCEKDWEALTMILNRGYDAVKELFPEAGVIIHVDDGSDFESCKWFFEQYINAGGKLDVLGVSYYPAWSKNTADVCFEFCKQMKDYFGMDTMIMETGFNWSPVKKDGYAGQLVDIDAYKDIYPPSPQGQAGFLKELALGLKDTQACLGFLYWDPVMIHVEDADGNNLCGWAYRESDDGVEPNVVENTTLFDFDGKALPVLDMLRETAPKKSYVITEYADGVLKSVKIADKYDKTASYLWDGDEIKSLY